MKEQENGITEVNVLGLKNGIDERLGYVDGVLGMLNIIFSSGITAEQLPEISGAGWVFLEAERKLEDAIKMGNEMFDRLRNSKKLPDATESADTETGNAEREV